MIPSLRVKRPLYPVIAIVSSVLILFGSLLLVKTWWFGYYFLSISLLLIFFGYGKVILKTLFVFFPVAIFVGLLTKINGSWIESLWAAERIFILGIAAVPTISMRPVDLVRAMDQSHAPRWLTLGLLITIRFLGVMYTEHRRIKRAIKLRGVKTAWYHPGIWYRAWLVPFMMRVLSISDMMALSLETRSFSMEEERTFYRRVQVHTYDYGFGIGLMAILIISFGAYHSMI